MEEMFEVSSHPVNALHQELNIAICRNEYLFSATEYFVNRVTSARPLHFQYADVFINALFNPAENKKIVTLPKYRIFS